MNETKDKPPRNIFDREPSSWQDLQKYVAQVFAEIGCRVETDVEVQLARNVANLDVFVRDISSFPHSHYVCECKHWTRRVPKSIVYSFRTVMQDLGANHGFVISRNGFQPGAREAVRFTNVNLLTWREFEEMMFDRWLSGITKKLNPLFIQANELMDDKYVEKLWQTKKCTEEHYDEWSGICQHYPLITGWALFQWHVPKGIGAIANIGFTDKGVLGTKHGVVKLDTYRKIVDAAPIICHHARRELERFWQLE